MIEVEPGRVRVHMKGVKMRAVLLMATVLFCLSGAAVADDPHGAICVYVQGAPSSSYYYVWDEGIPMGGGEPIPTSQTLTYNACPGEHFVEVSVYNSENEKIWEGAKRVMVTVDQTSPAHFYINYVPVP